MDEFTHRVHALLAEADRLLMSGVKLSLLEEAVRLADSQQDIPLGIQARYPLMLVARNLLRGDILAVAFTWCLGHYDRDPTLFAGRDLFWEHDMVVGQLANLDNVPRATLQGLVADLERRLREAGRSPAAALRVRRTIAADLGDRTMAAEADRELRRLGPAELGSLRQQIECLLFLGKEEEALSLAARCLRDDRRFNRVDAGTVRCKILLPLLRRGQVDQVFRHQDRCLSHLKPEVCYYWEYGNLIKSFALTNRTTQAVRIYERCQRAIQEFTDPLTRLHFALDAGVLFDRLAALGRTSIPVRLPAKFPVKPTQHGYSVFELGDWLRQEAVVLAARFDRRNGNGFFAEEIQERAALQRWALPELEALPESDS
jgi:hypothetical protein